MSHCLVIFTTTYPAGSMDGFVQDELPFLSAAFDEVLIFPVNAAGHLSQGDKVLPENCKAYVTNQRQPLAGRLRDIGCLIGQTFSSDPIFRNERRQKAKSFRSKLFLQYFEGRSKQAAKDIWPVLEPLLKKHNQITFYSYWLYVAARTMLLCRDRLLQNRPELTVNCFSRAHRYDLYEYVEPRNYLPYRPYFLENIKGVFPCSADGVHYLLDTQTKSKEERCAAPVYLARLGIFQPEEMVAALTEDERAELNRFLEQRQRMAEGALPVVEIVSCAWIRPVKRVDLLVDALIRLKEDTNVQWVWTHFGNAEKDSDFVALKERVKTDLNFMQVNLPGSKSKAFIMGYYLQVKPQIFVNTSSNEGVPVSIMEAMAAALPIYATDVGGTAEATGYNESGKLWPLEVNAEQIAEDLRSFANLSESERKALGKTARKRWEMLCQAKENYQQFAQVLCGAEPCQDIPFSNEPDERCK